MFAKNPCVRLGIPRGALAVAVLTILACGCVPKAPVIDIDVDVDAGTGSMKEPVSEGAAGVGSGPSRGSAVGEDNDVLEPGGSGDSSEGDVGTAEGEPPAMSTIEPEAIVDEMRYACQANSDCAEALVCQSQECVFVPPERAPTTIVQTSGGGLLTSPGMRLQLRVGAPSPAGRMGGAGHHLTLGPIAGH